MIAVRAVTAADVPTILGFVRDLAAFEREPNAVEATETTLGEALFGASPAAEAMIADLQGAPAGFALFFHNFSSWTGRRGLYLEDLYVAPDARGCGVGKALLHHLAGLALDRDCARFRLGGARLERGCNRLLPGDRRGRHGRVDGPPTLRRVP